MIYITCDINSLNNYYFLYYILEYLWHFVKSWIGKDSGVVRSSSSSLFQSGNSGMEQYGAWRKNAIYSNSIIVTNWGDYNTEIKNIDSE